MKRLKISCYGPKRVDICSNCPHDAPGCSLEIQEEKGVGREELVVASLRALAGLEPCRVPATHPVATGTERRPVAKGLGDGSIFGRPGINMWCLHCTSEKTQSLLELELELDSCVEGDAPGAESGPSLDGGAGYSRGPVTHSSALSPDHFDAPLYGHPALPGPQRPRRPKLQHSQSILRKQAEEEAIKRSRSLSESYELSTDLQDKQGGCGKSGWVADPLITPLLELQPAQLH
ncbi:hypothetical protein AAFF_G00190190 [Aldrovandia affinis]|uniref:Uncharacterized protein n=1 Tax=Aldrovandia affinis TaxID=143900 RepID=A0AAD7W6M0_9TELE|nr:hypothetical protein AAFF_G00190190 [Aldrovandia affinis]